MCSCCSGCHGAVVWRALPKSPSYPSHVAAGTQWGSEYLWTPPALSSAGCAALLLRWGLVFLQRSHHVLILRWRQRSVNVQRWSDVMLWTWGRGYQIYKNVALSVPISFPKEMIEDSGLILSFCSLYWISRSWIFNSWYIFVSQTTSVVWKISLQWSFPHCSALSSRITCVS